MSDHERRSNFTDAVQTLSLEEIRLVIQFTKEHYEMYGKWPTATQIAADLKLHERR